MLQSWFQVFYIVLFLTLALVKFSHAITLRENMTKTLEEQRIIPDCIPTTPAQFLKIKYIHTVVEFGSQIDSTTIMFQPTELKWEAEKDAFYTLILTGLDVPTRENNSNSEFNHWIVGNIPGKALFAGDTIAEYVGTGLYYGRGMHRLVFLIYKQPGIKKIKFEEPRLVRESEPNRRMYFGAQMFSGILKVSDGHSDMDHHKLRLSLLIFGSLCCLEVCLAQLIEGSPADPWNVVHPKKTSDEIIDALKKHKIIPEIIQRVAIDVQVCEVSYNETVVDFGNVINYTYIQEHIPTHIKWPYKKGVLYTLILSSPDAPGVEEHNERELRLWLVGNIPENNIENGTAIADYVGMVPFYEEGHHRYIYFVFEQEEAGHIDFHDEVHITSNVVSLMRAYHHTEEFRKEYNLGSIVAVNFFLMNFERRFYI